MLELTSLDLLYIVLMFFTTIIWTLLVLVLFRILKILWPIIEMVNLYKKIKQLLSIYAQIPEMIKEKIMGIINKEKKEMEWEKEWD